MFAIFVLAVWIICVSFHEYCHALVAYAGGDTGVKDRGYLSFNFLLYIDPFLSIFLPMVFLHWVVSDCPELPYTSIEPSCADPFGSPLCLG